MPGRAGGKSAEQPKKFIYGNVLFKNRGKKEYYK